MGAGPPKGNKNAEVWNEEDATTFMELAVSKSENEKYDFIGEVAKDLKQDKGVFDYLVSKFTHLKRYKSRIKYNCEVNCFRNGKNGDIVPSLAIMNLKSNHGWTDRAETTLQGGDKPIQTTSLTPEEAASIAKELNNKY